jgi:Enoyl-CoA hydratase/carnithine racemase
MTAINAVTDLTREGDIAVLTINSPPVNALSADVRNGLRDGARQAAADPAVKAIVLICAGRTFIAGADISEFGKPSQGATLPEIQSALEGSPKPVIAALHGTALGGGFEVALMCHYRVAAPSRRSACPKSSSGSCPAPVAHSACRALRGSKMRSTSFFRARHSAPNRRSNGTWWMRWSRKGSCATARSRLPAR